MGNVISEGLEHIGKIDSNGYVFDTSGDNIAIIDSDGYINKPAGYGCLGKIDDDGTIRNASFDVIGRIQADGYVYIHSRRVCKVSSSFVERITPKAWNAGEPSTYSGRRKEEKESYGGSSGGSFFFSPFFIKLVLGLALGVFSMVKHWGGAEMLLVGPMVVFIFSIIYKIFNH